MISTITSGTSSLGSRNVHDRSKSIPFEQMAEFVLELGH
jgi:hypothetical protein